MANSSLPDSPIAPFPGIVIVEPYLPEIYKYMETPEANTNDQIGIVLAVGAPDISLYHPDVKVTTPAKIGDIIFHTPQYHAPYKDLKTGKEYKLVKFTEIKGVLRSEEGKK